MKFRIAALLTGLLILLAAGLFLHFHGARWNMVEPFADVRTPSFYSPSSAVDTPEDRFNQKEISDFVTPHREPATSSVTKIPHTRGRAVICSSIEAAGGGPSQQQLGNTERKRFIDLYHSAKDDLIAWAEMHRKVIGEKTLNKLQILIKDQLIQRPPSEDQRDLSWRGHLAWMKDPSGARIIRVGSGFLEQMEGDPDRAKFEMIRALAQAWAPEELDRIGVVNLWKPLTQCLKANDPYEATWALSTAIATLVTHPGCVIPAFMDKEAAACLQLFPIEISGKRSLASP